MRQDTIPTCVNRAPLRPSRVSVAPCSELSRRGLATPKQERRHHGLRVSELMRPSSAHHVQATTETVIVLLQTTLRTRIQIILSQYRSRHHGWR
jgi:hypothetical protein